MKRNKVIACSMLLALGSGSLVFTQSVQAGGPFNMFNPSKWFGGNDRGYDDYYYDRYDRYYDRYRPYGYGRGYGWGWYGGPYGWPGYGMGPYGYQTPQNNSKPQEPIPQ